MNNVKETEQGHRAAQWGHLSTVLAVLVIGVLALGPGARPAPPISLAEARGAPAQAQGSAVHLAGLAAHPARLSIGRWFFAHSLPDARGFATATRMGNGQVLVAGGAYLGNGSETTAYLLNPYTLSYTPTGSMIVSRQQHTATLLYSGKVLIVGGAPCGECYPWARAELYDPATGTFSPTDSLATPRAFHTATLLPTGKVLIASGCTSIAENCYPASSVISTTELYNPATGTFSPGGALTGPRAQHTATLPRSGTVLLVG